MLSTVSHRAFYVWYRNVLSYQRYVWSTFIASFGEPLLYLISMGLGMGSYMGLINGQSYLQFIAPGLVVSSCMSAATYECCFSAFSRMHIEKIYDSQLITPISVGDIVTGEILWGITRSMLSGFVLCIILAAFGLIHSPWALLYPLLWILVGYVFSTMGMLMTSYAQMFDFFTFYIELWVMPSFFFSGIFFPLDHMPQFVQWISMALPLTQAVQLSRALITGHLHLALLGSVVFLIVWGTAFYLWALQRMQQRLIV